MGFFVSLHQFSDFALLILRLALGTVFLFHGLPKKGLWKAQPSDQLPAGLLTRLRILSIVEPAGALGLVIVMVGAITFLRTKAHRKFKEANAPGWEFEFMLLVVALALAILGGGKYALDRVVFGI